MLMARRLCERGAGFVTVTTNFVWDMHADKNNATMTEGMDYVAMAKRYRQQAQEQGLLRTLKEKSKQTPVIQEYINNILLSCRLLSRVPRHPTN